jgi:hypothetical protein
MATKEQAITKLTNAQGVTVGVSAEKAEQLLATQPTVYFKAGSREAKAAVDAQPAPTVASQAIADRSANKAAAAKAAETAKK